MPVTCWSPSPRSPRGHCRREVLHRYLCRHECRRLRRHQPRRRLDERLLSVADYRGLAYRSPLLGAALAFFLLSLIGIPFTGGFFGKFYVFTAALHSGEVWLAIMGLFNSGVAAYYYLRLVTSAYSRPSETVPLDALPAVQAPLLIALLFTVATTLILGIFPGQVLEQAKAGAMILYPSTSAPNNPAVAAAP